MYFWLNIKRKVWGFFYDFFLLCKRKLSGFRNIGPVFKRRQKYHIGWLAPDKTLEDLKVHLHSEWGFGDHFFYLPNSGEVLSWRKIDKDSDYQYHIRVFHDGEIRGHVEYTPESHPLGHFRSSAFKEARNDFLRFLGDFVVYRKHISYLAPDTKLNDPKAEIIEEGPSVQQ